MMKSKIKPKVTRKRAAGKRKQKPFFLIFLSIPVLFIVFVSIYVFLFFSDQLSEKIKNDFLEIYNPVSFDDSEQYLVFKLKDKPEEKYQKSFYSEIKNKYGLITYFENIYNEENKGIVKISFYRGRDKFTDIKESFFYWDKKMSPEYEVKPVIENDSADSQIVKDENYRKIEVTEDKKPPENVEIPESKKTKKKDKIVNREFLSLKRELSESINLKEYKKKKSDIAMISKPVSRKERPEVKNIYKLAIVIDDVGYDYSTIKNLFELGIPLTFAIIPEQKKSKEYYDIISRKGFDVILHIPMEPQKGKIFVEKNALLTSMNDDDLRKRIDRFIDEYPKATGANNHMGSLAVTDMRLMNIVIEELSKKKMFWLDSMTSSKTITKEVCNIYNLDYFERNVFLDNEKDYYSIKKSFEKLIVEAKKTGFAVGIGHAQTKELAGVLKEYFLKKDDLGIEFVRLRK